MKFNLLYIVRKLDILVAASYLRFFASVKYDAIRRVPTEAIVCVFYVIEYVKNFKLSMLQTSCIECVCEVVAPGPGALAEC